MAFQVEDTIVARRDSRNRGFLNPTSIINFRWQLEIIKPKMPSREQLPWKPINSASVYGTNFLNMCTEAVTTTIKRQDQKLKEMSLESVLPPKAAQRAQAAWDKLNAKAWLEQKINNVQVKPVKPSVSMLSKAMIFLCLLPFLAVFVFSFASLLMAVLGFLVFEGSLLTIGSALLGGFLFPVISFVSLVGGVVFAAYHYSKKTMSSLKSKVSMYQSVNKAGKINSSASNTNGFLFNDQALQMDDTTATEIESVMNEFNTEDVDVAVEEQFNTTEQQVNTTTETEETETENLVEIIQPLCEAKRLRSRRNKSMRGVELFQLASINPSRRR